MHLDRTAVLLLVAIFVACLMDGLDGAIVNVAMPTIAEAFGTDTGTVSWTALAYLLAVACTIFIFGNLAANGWLKRLFIGGFVLFTVASVFCGFAPTLPVLIAARFAEGLGASMLVACAPVICVKHLPREYLGLSFGLMAAATSVGFSLGPAIGGILTYMLSWHWIFWINVPIGIAAIIFSFRVIPGGCGVFDPAQRQPFDLIGAIALCIFMAALTVALERLPHLGGLHPAILCCAVLAVAALVYFIYHSVRTPHPVLNIRVFRSRAVSCIVVTYLIVQVVLSGFIYLMPFFFTNQFGMDTLLCGILMLIQPAITALLGTSCGRWSDRHGRRVFCVVSSALLAVMAGVIAFTDPAVGLLPFIFSLVGFGIGFALACGPMCGQIVDQLAEEDREAGSTLTVAVVYIAAVVGTALFAALFTLVTGDGGTVPSFADLGTQQFLTGFRVSMVTGVILLAVATVLAFSVRDRH